MDQTTYKRPEDNCNVFRDLDSKFSANLDSSLSTFSDVVHRIDIKARACTTFSRLLHRTNGLTTAQKELLGIFDELFADVIISIYLAGCALDRPAQMLLRRALELGVAAVYLWDMPHIFWAWRDHDKDLSFAEMVDHFNTPGYQTLISFEHTNGSQPEIDVSAIKKIYRSLSNTVHGKMATFESALPDRFNHNHIDWKSHLALVEDVQDVILGLWQYRFPHLFSELDKEMPQITRLR